MSRTLVRLRANPEKVRVAIRRCGREWVATVSPRGSHPLLDPNGEPVEFETCEADPAAAVFDALLSADSYELPGVDLGMEWAYQHPQVAQ